MSETALGFNLSLAERDLRLAERAYDKQILELANREADAVIADGGITRELGQFTLAMFGHIGDLGQANEDISQHFQQLDETINYNYDVPVGVFEPGFDDVTLYKIGYAPRRGRLGGGSSPLHYQIETTTRAFSPAYKATVALTLKDVHRLSHRDDKIVEREPQESVRLAVVNRSQDYIATDFETREHVLLGWQAIYGARKLGRPGHKMGDDAFLALIGKARNRFER